MSVNILHLEDSLHDAELVRSMLEAEGMECAITRVDTEPDFLQAIRDEKFDLIISDCTIPGFDGRKALSLAKQKSPETPFVFCSGTIGEDAAVESLLNGATDYVLKTRMSRLVPAVNRALRESEDRKGRTAAEEALRSSEEQYKTIYESSPVGIANFTADGGFLQCNPALLRLLDYSEHELHKMTLTELIDPDDQSEVLELFSELNNGSRELVEAEERFIRRDGWIVWVHLTASVIRDDRGNVLHTISILQDISERKKAEEALHVQSTYFQQLFENSPLGIAMLDEGERVVEINKSFENLFRFMPREIHGKLLDDLIVPADRLDEARRITSESRDGQTIQRETIRKNKEGTPVDVAVIGYPIVIKGKRVGTYALYADISERKKLEAQFLRTQRMESIGTLAGGIAHDLNNALGPIIVGVQMLRKKLPDPGIQSLLATIEASAKRGAAMVKQVLTFARGVEGERIVIRPKHLIDEIEKIIQDTFPKAVRIEKQVPQSLWNVTGDSTQLHQVLLNLCVNARDAMPNGGTLTLSVENFLIDRNFARMHPEAKEGPYVLIKTADTGDGIPPGILQKIFEPFFTTKEVGKGTGLGLSSVVSIVKGHGGFVDVYSEVKRGTTFKVYLPAVPSTESVQAEHESQSLPMGNNELVLIVDDEESIRSVTTEILETYRYRVLSASDGTDAVSAYVTNKDEISVVLTDMMMPFMDGRATIRALRKIDPAVRIIATSGLSAAPTLKDKEEMDVQAFLEKPYTAEKLLFTLHAVLRGRKGTSEKKKS